jgi:hypothetical protein
MPVKLISSGITDPCDSGCNPGKTAAPVLIEAVAVSVVATRCAGRHRMGQDTRYRRTGARCLDRIPGADQGQKAGVGTWARKTDTGAWTPLPIVTVTAVTSTAASSAMSAVHVRTVGRELDVRPDMEASPADASLLNRCRLIWPR